MTDRLIFLSYSHEDETWKKLVEKQLKALEQGNIDVWTDEDIGAGDDWYEKIENALNNAWVAILLISENSLTSEFILKKEVATLLEKRDADKNKLRIVPLIIRDCPWKLHPWLEKMQVRPQGGKALEKMRKADARTVLTNLVYELAASAKKTPVVSESQFEGPDRATPEASKNVIIPDPKSLQELEEREKYERELKAEVEAKLQEFDKKVMERRISEMKGAPGTQSSPPSAIPSAYRDSLTKPPEQTQTKEVYAKKDE